MPIWIPSEAMLLLAAAVAIAGYLFLMRSLAKLIDERFDPLHDWREAERRAEAMLSEMLPATDQQYLSQRGYLEVPSGKFAERRYRIPRFQGPVAVYERGSLVNLLCVRSVEPIPNADAILLHKLMIEGDEEGYLKAANSIRPRPYSFTV
ncbi:MAG: hypothetical protein ACYC3S_05535 [Chloroflexota bacterium]